jgi:hypothetical protein
MPQSKDKFSISLTLDVSPDGGERYHVLVTLEIEDDGRPFARTRIDWYDMRQEAVDYVANLFHTITQGELPLFVEQVSEREMLNIELRAISALLQLNVLANAAEGKTREDKGPSTTHSK